MRIVFHAAAEEETEAVADYHDLQLPELGADFKSEEDRVVTTTRLALFQNWNKLA